MSSLSVVCILVLLSAIGALTYRATHPTLQDQVARGVSALTEAAQKSGLAARGGTVLIHGDGALVNAPVVGSETVTGDHSTNESAGAEAMLDPTEDEGASEIADDPVLQRFYAAFRRAARDRDTTAVFQMVNFPFFIRDSSCAETVVDHARVARDWYAIMNAYPDGDNSWTLSQRLGKASAVTHGDAYHGLDGTTDPFFRMGTLEFAQVAPNTWRAVRWNKNPAHCY